MLRHGDDDSAALSGRRAHPAQHALVVGNVLDHVERPG
jgi:hypothetical protein